MAEIQIKNIIEAALLAAGKPLTLDNILDLFMEEEKPERSALREAIDELRQDYADRSIELMETGAGFRINVRSDYASWISRLWEERPPKYSRAMLETLSLIAYRQPVTRGEIEDVRGVSVSSSIIKTLMERHWIREVGHRDVPGRPALLATTKEFLNYFGLKGLGDLPTLSEIKDLESINCELDLGEPGEMSKDPEEAVDASTDEIQISVEAVDLSDSEAAAELKESPEQGMDPEPEYSPQSEAEHD